METIPSQNQRSVQIRRFVAIGLTLLSILCLFWPSAVAISSEASKTEEFAQLVGLSDAEGLNAVKDILYQDNGGYNEVEKYPELTEKAERSFLAFFRAIRDGKLSYFDVRTIATSLLGTMADVIRVAKPQSGSFSNLSPAIPTAGSVTVNVLFFLMIAFGVGSVLMMLFNKSRVFGVLLTVLAFLFAGIMLMFLLVIPDDHGVKVLLPGASLFLLPVCSLAACIVYKRVKPE